MREVNLAAIDLNLLIALDALLGEGSVSGAARAVGLSQPAMSRALGRLRDLFDDPLMVRSGHAMVPTPRALELAQPLGAAIEAIRETLRGPEAFDPATALRSFRIGAIDATQAVLLAPLLDRIGDEAPGVEVSTSPLRTAAETVAELVAGQLDLAVGRFDGAPEGVRREPLFEDRIVCIVRADHPRIRKRLTIERYLKESHLATDTVSPIERPFTIEALLARQGLERRVVCRVDGLGTAPLVAARTDLVCTAPRSLVEPFAAGLGLRMFDPPFEAPGYRLDVAWHVRHDEDAANRWLRETLISVAETLRE